MFDIPEVIKKPLELFDGPVNKEHVATSCAVTVNKRNSEQPNGKLYFSAEDKVVFHVHSECDTNHYDLGMAAFLLDTTGCTRSARNFVFYNNRSTENRSVEYSYKYDVVNGTIDLLILFDLAKIDPTTKEIAVVLFLQDALVYGRTLLDLNKLTLRISNLSNKKRLLEKTFDFSNGSSSVMIGKITCNGNSPVFEFSGLGTNLTLAEYCGKFGLEVV